MLMKDSSSEFGELAKLIKGEVLSDNLSRALYSSDASVYQELPTAVVFPRDSDDISIIAKFSEKNNIPIIARGAGTSLAGQVVGKGLIMDVSRYMNRILEINVEEKWAEVESGVILDDLNRELAKYNLFFAPETSTSNRCTIGGMTANNSCGVHSIIYGSTRDHLLEVTGCFADGEKITFGPLSDETFEKKCSKKGREGDIYRFLRDTFNKDKIREQIRDGFPHPEIRRRNVGYAIDELLSCSPFLPGGDAFNLSKIVAGSEGSLVLISSVKLSLVPLPLPEKILLCAHFYSLSEALEANLVAVSHKPDAVELMDKNILDLARKNPLQNRNRFFVEGDPGALLLIEYSGMDYSEVEEKAKLLIKMFKEKDLGYAFPLVGGKDISRVWELRKAGLGILSNMKGDERPVTLIEDTALRVEDLPAYVEDIEKILALYGKRSVYHAHVGSGELHIRPVLNLKKPDDRRLFRKIAEDVALLVKKYRGSLSGEHGDGRLRAEFIPQMVGKENYTLMVKLKEIFDPKHLLNPGKIINADPMDDAFRYLKPPVDRLKKPVFDWSDDVDFLGAVERCNGSADCIKGVKAGGAMCPSYMGTREEKNSTRGRANVLRAFLQGKKFEEDLSIKEVTEVLDLCLSCKACKSECPSGVDMAALKAEFMQHVHDIEGVKFSAGLMANLPLINRFVFTFRKLANPMLKSRWMKQLLRRLAGISPKRQLPLYSGKRFDRWYMRYYNIEDNDSTEYLMLLADEFTNYYDSDIGIKTVLLLNRLGYKVIMAPVSESGRTYISQGFLRSAATVVKRNLEKLKGLISEDMPLVGIEPSALLTFRDEYPKLAPQDLRAEAKKIAAHSFTVEEFLYNEMKKGKITKNAFTDKYAKIRFHAHCYQKALMKTDCIKEILSFPTNYSAEEIPSGCCGMAGGFGYEEEKYELSMKIGELVLFPEVKNTPESTFVVAPGHSCRHQIKDGTQRDALHPVEILFDALL